MIACLLMLSATNVQDFLNYCLPTRGWSWQNCHLNGNSGNRNQTANGTISLSHISFMVQLWGRRGVSRSDGNRRTSSERSISFIFVCILRFDFFCSIFCNHSLSRCLRYFSGIFSKIDSKLSLLSLIVCIACDWVSPRNAIFLFFSKLDVTFSSSGVTENAASNFSHLLFSSKASYSILFFL